MSAAGPSQGARAPLGGSELHEVKSVGASLSAAGPSQGARDPSGDSEDAPVSGVGATYR